MIVKAYLEALVPSCKIVAAEKKMTRILPKHVLTAGSVLTSVVTGLNMMELIPYGGLTLTNGIMMLTFGLVVAVDFFNERRKRYSKGVRLLEVIALTLIVPAFCLGVITILEIPVLGWEKLTGFVFIALSVAMAYSVITEERNEED